MKVVVTGASGLVGSHLLDLLKARDIFGIGLSRDNESLTRTDYSVEQLTRIFYGCDAIVHLAAVRVGGYSYAFYQENEILTENVLKAMINAGVEKLIYMSSISVYSDINKLPWTENQIVSPVSLYGISKLTGEYLCMAYANKGIEAIVFRCAHILGLENKPYMIGNFLRGAVQNDTICVRGKSVAKREFIYVKDVARAIIWALENDVVGVFNLGTNSALTNLEVGMCINSVFHNDGNLAYEDEHDEGISSSYMESKKLYNAGWIPSYSFQDAISDIYKEHFR